MNDTRFRFVDKREKDMMFMRPSVRIEGRLAPFHQTQDVCLV